MTADENYPDMNDFYLRVVSSDDENYLDSDNGSVTDFDGSMSEGAYCVVSDDGSAADLDVDMLDIVDYNDSDIGFVMDVSSCSSGVDVEDDCLMALFRTVMYLVHYWTGRIVYTGPDEGSGRYWAWMEQFLSGLYPPCVVDWLPNGATEIKAFDRFSVIHVDGNNSDPQRAYVRGVPLKMFSMGRTSLRLTGCSGRGGGSVDCFDWLHVDCAVTSPPGKSGVAI